MDVFSSEMLAVFIENFQACQMKINFIFFYKKLELEI